MSYWWNYWPLWIALITSSAHAFMTLATTIYVANNPGVKLLGIILCIANAVSAWAVYNVLFS